MCFKLLTKSTKYFHSISILPSTSTLVTHIHISVAVRASIFVDGAKLRNIEDNNFVSTKIVRVSYVAIFVLDTVVHIRKGGFLPG